MADVCVTYGACASDYDITNKSPIIWIDASYTDAEDDGDLITT